MKIKVFQVNNQTILNNNFEGLYIKISGKKIDVDRDLTIYTWSKLKNIPVECDILFDLSEIKIPKNDSTGLDEEVQNVIQNHNTYNDILKSILKCIELNETIIVAEHDCMMTKEFTPLVTEHGLFSFAATTRTAHSIAGVGYIITPPYAKRMVKRATTISIKSPCDGFIHSYQLKRMKYRELSNKFLHKQVFARHYVNPKIGTVKKSVGKRK